MTEPIIKLDKISFSYDDTPILNDVSFHVNPGEFLGYSVLMVEEKRHSCD